MKSMTSYTAECHRNGNGWAIEVLGETVHTQAPHLDQVQDVAREAIAVVLEVDVSEIDVEVRPVLDHGQHALDAARHAGDVEELAVLGSQEAQALAVIELTAAGLSPHDIGWLLGVSHQRVHHLSQVDRTKVILRNAAAAREHAVTDALVNAEAIESAIESAIDSALDSAIAVGDLRPLHSRRSRRFNGPGPTTPRVPADVRRRWPCGGGPRGGGAP